VLCRRPRALVGFKPRNDIVFIVPSSTSHENIARATPLVRQVRERSGASKLRKEFRYTRTLQRRRDNQFSHANALSCLQHYSLIKAVELRRSTEFSCSKFHLRNRPAEGRSGRKLPKMVVFQHWQGADEAGHFTSRAGVRFGDWSNGRHQLV
jgi:hypothetical protein